MKQRAKQVAAPTKQPAKQLEKQPEKQFDFTGKRHLATAISLVLIIISIVSLSLAGLKLGIDFTGGIIIEVEYPQSADIDRIKNRLEQSGFAGVAVQYFGNNTDVLIRLAPQKITSVKLSSEVLQMLKKDNAAVKMRRVEYVGPKIGEELTNDGALAILYALIGILIYVALRFEYRFSIGAIIALIHDVIITLGVFSILQIEFDLTVLAAILAVIGYSLNDSIVVFDRMRENFLTTRKTNSSLILNDALNQTLARTLTTSGTTILVLLALFFLGGEIIHSFSIALLIGVIIGTYSSVYVAGSTLLATGIKKEHLLPSEKEKKSMDTRP